MTRAFKCIKDYLEKINISFEADDVQRIIRSGFRGRNGYFSVAIFINSDNDLFQCLSMLPINAPEHKRRDVAEVCVRATYGMKIGNFEMDFSDGEIRFRTSVKYVNDFLDEEILSHLIGINLLMADMYFPAFAKVIYADHSPESAVDAVEQDIDNPGSEPHARLTTH